MIATFAPAGNVGMSDHMSSFGVTITWVGYCAQASAPAYARTIIMDSAANVFLIAPSHEVVFEDLVDDIVASVAVNPSAQPKQSQ